MRSIKYCWGSDITMDLERFFEGDLDGLEGISLDFLRMCELSSYSST